jgi:3,4-dihydroxy 2-butanone 4-phosphate synthase / GTP cyclohydrolase II
MPGPVLASAPLAPALEALRTGRMAVVFDGECGDVVLAADHIHAGAVTFMALHARGLVSLALTAERCAALALKPVGGSSGREEFMVSVEARTGVDTGISAADRARTIAVAADPATGPDDLVRPGHVFPIRTRPGGVLERAACPEAAVDLVRVAGSTPAAVTCTVLDEHGATAALPELRAFCARHDLPLVHVEEVAAQRVADESRVERVESGRIRAGRGWFETLAYRSLPDGTRHEAATTGRVAGREDVPVHIRTACLACDTLRSTTCDCGTRLEEALATFAREGSGILVQPAPTAQAGARGEAGVRGQAGASAGRGAAADAEAIADQAGADAGRERALAVAAAIVAQLAPASVAVVHGGPEQLVALARAGVRARMHEETAGASVPAARELPRLLAAPAWTGSGGFN